MASIKKSKFRVDNGTDFDTHYFETSADQIKDGVIVDLADLDLVTEPGCLVDALAVAELNSNINASSGSFSGFSWTNVNSFIKKRGNEIHIHVEFTVSGAVANNEYTFATIPLSLRPSKTYKFSGWCANGSGNRYSASAKVSKDGNLYFISRSEFVEGGFDAFYYL